MKKLLVFLFAISLAAGASAQKGHRGGSFHVRPRVIVGIGGGFGGYYPYSPYYQPYSPFYRGYGYNPYARPSRLDLDIQGIKLDYEDRIKSVKMDDGLKRREKRERIKELKYERDKAIIDAKKDYYYRQSPR
ncbi:MAG: hypothetical protein ABI415_02540 [Flavitalea sp.]